MFKLETNRHQPLTELRNQGHIEVEEEVLGAKAQRGLQMQMMEQKNEKKTDPRPIVESELCIWQVPILKLKVDGVYSLES